MEMHEIQDSMKRDTAHNQDFLPFSGWIVFCHVSFFFLHIYSLMGIWVASIFWSLWIMLPWICLHKYPETELLNHMIFAPLIFEENLMSFSVATVPCYIPTNGAFSINFSTFPSTFVTFTFQTSSHPFFLLITWLA